METSRDELFQRYYDAAGAISIRSPTRHKGVADAQPDDSSAENADLLTDPMERLLSRQARLLQRIHSTQRGDAGDSSSVDDVLVLQRLDDLASIVVSKFYAYRYDRVPDCWGYLYTDTLVLISYFHLLRLHHAEGDSQQELWSLLVESLDRALITSGGQSQHLGQRWIEETMELLDSVLQQETDQRPSKRQKMSDTSTISLAEPYGRPKLSPSRECPRHRGWTLDKFESYMNRTGAPKPVVFTDLIGDWPALTDRPWHSVDYLLSQTLGGRRLVPVEVGRSYVDEGWGQELIPFRTFLDKYVLAADPSQQQQQQHRPPVGYLAQHNLFRQIPPLRNDMRIPDFCWADVPPHPCDPSRDQPALDMPQLNAWLGPARTITPLHTDGYHNLLCQVVGRKYVRLYPPGATAAMRPREVENGVDMSNTGAVDVGVVEGWDPVGEEGADGEREVERMREKLKGVEYWECILGPGDTLLIPLGWWHYVRSLSVSFSVSFWWN